MHQHNPNVRYLIAICVFCGAGVYAAAVVPGYVLTAIGVSLYFQIFCWSIGFLLITQSNEGQSLRLCDPGPLLFGIFLIYGVYPSLIWCSLQTLPYNVALTLNDGSLLFILHGLYYLGIALGYRLLRSERPASLSSNSIPLPSSVPLLAVGMSVVLFALILRVASGGGLVPNVNYGTNWFAFQQKVSSARTEGGGSYLLVQLISRTSIYPPVILGVGFGLLLAKALRGKRYLFRNIALITLLATVFYVFGDGGRSPVIFSMLAMIFFADAIAGPLRLRYFIPVIAVLLLGFVFAGYFRQYREFGLVGAFRQGNSDFQNSAVQDSTGEFTSMLAKESTIIDIYRTKAPEGINYLIESVVSLVPSQLIPNKVDYETTALMLSREYLRSSADEGAGVAGASIGDGYRFGGVIGVPVLGCLFGMIIGLVQRWSFRGNAHGPYRPVLLRIALAAWFFSMAFVVIRASLGEMIVYAFYMVLLPWLTVTRLIPGSLWIQGASEQINNYRPMLRLVAGIRRIPKVGY
jgi:hypothetical protein